MSGHNKWSSIKHRKAAQDAKRGAAFNKVIRELVVAAKEGGADPATNFALASAIERAKIVNLPRDTMEKAIKRGAGELGGESYVRTSYEGRGPGCAAFIIEVLTDNKNRTVADVRHIFTKHGGQLGETNSVGWMFERKGLLVVKSDHFDEDALMEACLEAGADDFSIDGEVAEIYTALEDLQGARAWFIESATYALQSAELAMIPKDQLEITDKKTAKRLLRMLDALDDCDDVQRVFSNWAMSDELVEEAAGE